MTHRKMAQDCWRLIKALIASDEGISHLDESQAERDAAAINLIEMACDSAAEAHEREVAQHDPAEQRAERYALEARDLTLRLMTLERELAARERIIEVYERQLAKDQFKEAR